MITYYFPPLGGIPPRRSFRFAKNLLAFCWNLTALTVLNPAIDEAVRDNSLLSGIPNDVKVIRTLYPDISLIKRVFKRLMMKRLAYYIGRFMDVFPPDKYIGWIPFAYFAARRIVRKGKINAIYTQSYPYSDHLIGYLLKRSTGKPWIADFRDEWTQCPILNKPLFQWQRKLNVWMEQRVLHTADKVIITTDSYRDAMSSLVPSEMGSKFVSITNGYDKADFKHTETYLRKSRDKLIFLYAGMFYGPHQPTHFLSAMRCLIKEGFVSPDFINMVFVGGTGGGPGLDDSSTEGIETIITKTGIVSHGEAIQWMQKADVLWLVVGSKRGKGNLLGKVFEYIATGILILALVPLDGEMAALLRKTHTAVAIVDPDDINSIKNAILSLYNKWEQGTLEIDPNWEEISKYESKTLSKQLSDVLDTIIEPSQKMSVKDEMELLKK